MKSQISKWGKTINQQTMPCQMMEQNRNAPSGLTSAHCYWVCHAIHKNVCMLEWHAIKHPYLPTYLGCMIKLLIYFYAS